MNREFHVTQFGITIDGRGVMPGSVLKLKADPPSHWQRFGELKKGPEKASEVNVTVKNDSGQDLHYEIEASEKPAKKEFEVATPQEDSEALEALREEYKAKFGEEPDGRWKEKKLKKELGD